MIDIMIFSRNRALQLNALLETLGEYSIGDAQVTVLYHYDEGHLDSLNEVMESYPFHSYWEQDDFETQVKEFLHEASTHVMFLVDDIIVKAHVDFDFISNALEQNPALLTFSLRLGLHLDYCYPLQSSQPLPGGSVYPPGIFVWEWPPAKMDWQYPLSVDGHVFRKEQLSAWVDPLKFDKPNRFEEVMQTIPRTNSVPGLCICYAHSKIMNMPLNRVQDEYVNNCADIEADYLLQRWAQGDKLDASKYARIINHSAHEVLELYFKGR